MWAILAEAGLGSGDHAASLFALVNPINHALTADDTHRYKVEPYVVAADVYASPRHEGRGGWTWYTGSAAWMLRAGIEGILGLTRKGDSLRFDPCLPKGWPQVELRLTLRPAPCRVTVLNSSGLGRGVTTALLNGRPLLCDGSVSVPIDHLTGELVINLDAISDQGDGSKARVVTYGSIGKQLLTAFIVGKQAHAGYPQDGVNAAFIAAELISAFEGNADFVETSGAEKTASPTVLCAKDLKEGYNVTTPHAFWAYWNTMQYQRSGTEVLAMASATAATALKRVSERGGGDVRLMTLAELVQLLPSGTLEKIANTYADAEGLDLPERAKRITEALWQKSGLVGPAVVLGFGSIPYLAVSLKDNALRGRIEKAVMPFDIGALNYFAGISDMSFFGEARGELSVVAANTPIWGTSFLMPEAAGLPTINLGPWGRDYHHWLERLHTPYAFEVLPKALLAVIDAVA